MKISGAIIQERNISENTPSDFFATYKGKQISISTSHELGKPNYEHLKRYSIDVVDIRTGMFDVQTYSDCYSMRDAIREALKGACLIK